MTRLVLLLVITIPMLNISHFLQSAERYTWQSTLNQFTIDSPQSVSTEEEVFRNTCTIDPAGFLANNLEVLMEIITMQDELKQRWLRRFSEEAQPEVRQSVEAKALLEALD